MSTETPFDGSTEGNATASLTYPMQASQLAKGDHIQIKNQPCRIVAKSTSKPGKHGHAKVNFDAFSLLTTKKLTDLHPAHATVSVPVVTMKPYLLLDITADGYLSLWDQHSGEAKDDVKVPGEGGKTESKIGGKEEEVAAKLAALWGKDGGRDIWVRVMGTMGREVVWEVREVEG
ncbi:MAG: hypothetical protein Q9170_007063 [Blastenia crenularia]